MVGVISLLAVGVGPSGAGNKARPVVVTPPPVVAPPDTIPVERPEAALRRIVATSLASGSIVEEPALVDGFGQYGLEPLDPGTRAAVRQGLDLFASSLIRAQATTYQPRWDIQLLFLDKASPEQRTHMTTELRRWFTEDVRELPKMPTTSTENRPVIELCRVSAAEVLAEYGDKTAAGPIRAWMNKGSVEPTNRERTLQALARLDNPCHGRWLVAEGSNDVALCPGAGLITVKACWFIDGRRDCGEPIPIESARYLARTIRLQTVRRAPLPPRSPLALAISGDSDIDVRIFPSDDARAIYIVERDMQASGLAWRSESPELVRWVIGWLKTAPPALSSAAGPKSSGG